MEIERARLTRQLARMKEEEGAIAEAAEILQEVAVVSCWGLLCAAVGSPRACEAICMCGLCWGEAQEEEGAIAARPCPPRAAASHSVACCRLMLQETFGAMAKTEKIAYILEQVRLCLDRKDFVRAQVRIVALVCLVSDGWVQFWNGVAACSGQFDGGRHPSLLRLEQGSGGCVHAEGRCVGPPNELHSPAPLTAHFHVPRTAYLLPTSNR